MDRLIYATLTAMRSQKAAQAVTANNLANAQVPGFRRELSSLSARWLDDARVQADDVVTTAQLEAGPVTATGNPLDLALDGRGWIAVQAADGGEAYTRRGDLKVSDTGVIETGDGLAVLGAVGPLTVPTGQALVIAADGSVSAGGVAAGRIKLVDAAPGTLAKRGDGLFGGTILDADPAVRVRAGALEGSNVSVAASLAELIEQSRGFDTSAKLIRAARDIDEGGTRLMRLDT
jgi:flagellar basal-body rod protein FlgF